MNRLKGALALALAAMLLTGAAAGAAEEGEGWREGLSPSKPYAGVPAVDLSKQLGYMIFSPTKTRDVENSCQRLYVYLPRKDVKAGEGLMQLCTEEDGVLWETKMNNAESIEEREMTRAERKSLLWGDGTCFEIKLPKSLELGRTYYVNMDRGCIETEDGALESPAVIGKNGWEFEVKGEYGVCGMEYRRVLNREELEPEPTGTPAPTATADPRTTLAPGTTPTVDPELERLIQLANGITPEPTATPKIEYEEGILKPKAGDEIHFELVLGGEATRGVAYGYNGTVDFPAVSYEESCEVTGEVLTENPAWGVIFLDAQGNELHRVEFR